MPFPKMFYRSDGTTTTVLTQAAQDALSGAWFESPAEFGLITAPSTADVALLTTTYSTGVYEGTAHATPYAPNGILVTPPSGLG